MIFRVTTLCSLMGSYQRFGGTYYLHSHKSSYKTSRCPEDYSLNVHCENCKSYTEVNLIFAGDVHVLPTRTPTHGAAH
jgi:hypothetical protein